MKQYFKRLYGDSSKSLLLLFVLIAFVSLAEGFSSEIFGNFYKDVYNIDAAQRAFIEFPRELPGVLVGVIIAVLSFMGDFKLAIIAQATGFIGITALGLSTFSFNVMLVFLFINSLGMHLFMPLSESMGMNLAPQGRKGEYLGRVASIRFAFKVLAGVIVFIGFRTEVFTFKSQTKPVFIIAAFVYLAAFVVAIILNKTSKKEGYGNKSQKRKFKLVFEKDYKYFYFVCILNGVQKQIAYVFGSWVIIDLLSKGADVMSALIIGSSLVGTFLLRRIGKWIDKFGVANMMYVDGFSFLIVYIIYGCIVYAITHNFLGSSLLAVIPCYIVFILDRMSMQFSIVRSVYLNSIAKKQEDISAVLSTGLSLDHVVAILSAQLSGWIWVTYGAHYVFFFAAFLSLGNLFAAYMIKNHTPNNT